MSCTSFYTIAPLRYHPYPALWLCLGGADEKELRFDIAKLDDDGFSQRGSVLGSPADFDRGLRLALDLEVLVIEVEPFLFFRNLLKVNLKNSFTKYNRTSLLCFALHWGIGQSVN